MNDSILLAHGSGGTMMKSLIDEIFFEGFGGEVLARGDDAAVLAMGDSAALSPFNIAISTDSYVVTPLFFPGGDIGRLAICGSVNDVATSGAVPRYISCAFIIEEGLPMSELREIVASMAASAAEAGVEIVTGDTKVVESGKADRLFINTTGIGVFEDAAPALSGANCKVGDAVLVSGTIGDHGVAIMAARENFAIRTEVKSDAAPLNKLIANVLAECSDVRAFRDPTRGGLASTLNEFAEQSQTSIEIDEIAVPVKDEVRGYSDLLGLDIFQIANEGKMVCVVAAEQAERALAAMKASPYGEDTAIIGRVVGMNDSTSASASMLAPAKPMVYAKTSIGTRRIIDTITGELLPRIC